MALVGLLAAPSTLAADGEPPAPPGNIGAAHGTMRLPEAKIAADDRPYTSFMGSPDVSVELMGLYGFEDETARFRPTGIFRFGPLILGLGVVVAEETEFNAHLEVMSYQSSGWDVAVGFGLADGGTLRFGVPLMDRVRARLMMAFDGGFVAGLGVEATAW